MDWFDDIDMGDADDSEMDEDDDDDEDEVRRLDAVLQQADLELAASRSAATSAAAAASTPVMDEVRKINNAIALNKEYDDKIRRLEGILLIRLRECRGKLADIQKAGPSPERLEVFRYINCGRPYFRDHNNVPAPDNDDAISAKADMYDFSLLTSVPGWTIRDKTQFTRVMIKMSLQMRREEYDNQIRALKIIHRRDPIKTFSKQLERLTRARNSLCLKIPFKQLALPLDRESDYDWELLVNELNKRHTAHEYRSLWKLYFHPSINKSSWDPKEHTKLQTIASTYNYQDWDRIAKDLHTGRTGYQCFVYYRTNMTNTCIGKKWTPEEVSYLQRIIDYYREDSYIPWGKIATVMENRTKVQIYNKYMRMLEQRKGRFLPQEDAVILNCVDKFGLDFKKMTGFLAHRSLVQIRARYQVLSKMRVSTVWSVEDDKKLIQIMTNQDCKTNFAMATQFFPGKNRVNIRSRYVTLLRWMKANPNVDIEYAPRRGARRLNHGQARPGEDLNMAMENLKNSLTTDVEVNKKDRSKISQASNEYDIEDAIVATLVNEGIKEMEAKKTVTENSVVLPQFQVTSACQNLRNLRKCLVFLGSSLSKESFDESKYKKDYPELCNSPDENYVKVKSYSKKQKVVTIKCDQTPDIWGNYVLTPRNYVFPPNYATITGCKALMAHVTLMGTHCNTLNLHVLVRRNRLLKEQLDVLLERFYTLFLWPMLLSNEGPSEFYHSKLKFKRESAFTRPPLLLGAPEVATGVRTCKKLKNCKVSQVIGLADKEENVETTESTTESELTEDSVFQ